MKTITDVHAEAQEYFSEIDQNIQELQAHAADLQKQIGSAKGFDVFKVKKVAALKTELEETKATLHEAMERRSEMIKEFWTTQDFNVHQYQDDRRKHNDEKYSVEIQAVADSIAALLDANKKLDDIENMEREALRDEAKLLFPYVTRDHKSTLQSIDNYWTPIYRALDDERLENVRRFLARNRVI